MNAAGSFRRALGKFAVFTAATLPLATTNSIAQSTVSVEITTEVNPIFGFFQIQDYTLNGSPVSGWGPTSSFSDWVYTPQSFVGLGVLFGVTFTPLVFNDPLDPGSYDVLIPENGGMHFYFDVPSSTAFANWNTVAGPMAPFPSSPSGVSDTLTYGQTGAEVGMLVNSPDGPIVTAEPADISIVGLTTVPEPPVDALLLSSSAAFGLIRRWLKARPD